METHEPHIMELFMAEKPHENLVVEFCETRTKLCSDLEKKLEHHEL